MRGQHNSVANKISWISVFSFSLTFPDCSSELIVKYGFDFHVSLNDISDPVAVGFRHSSVEANQTSVPAVELVKVDGTFKEDYKERIEITPQKFTLRAVTGVDEGSYTFSDSNGKVKKKICLNVKGESRKHIFKGSWRNNII